MLDLFQPALVLLSFEWQPESTGTGPRSVFFLTDDGGWLCVFGEGYEALKYVLGCVSGYVCCWPES